VSRRSVSTLSDEQLLVKRTRDRKAARGRREKEKQELERLTKENEKLRAKIDRLSKPRTQATPDIQDERLERNIEFSPQLQQSGPTGQGGLQRMAFEGATEGACNEAYGGLEALLHQTTIWNLSQQASCHDHSLEYTDIHSSRGDPHGQPLETEFPPYGAPLPISYDRQSSTNALLPNVQEAVQCSPLSDTPLSGIRDQVLTLLESIRLKEATLRTNELPHSQSTTTGQQLALR